MQTTGLLGRLVKLTTRVLRIRRYYIGAADEKSNKDVNHDERATPATLPGGRGRTGGTV